MGVLEAAAIGALVGGLGGFVVYLLAAQATKGRSVVALHLPGWDAARALQVAHAYFAQRGLATEPVPDGIVGRTGSEWVTGVRVIELRARARGDGVDVHVDAYVRGFYPKEITVNPDSLLGMIPRRNAYELAQGLLASYGVYGAPWQHRHA